MRRAALLLIAAVVGTLALRPAAALPFGPPEASMTYSPRPAPTGVTVTFTITAFDPDGPVTGGKLEYGDGTSDSFFFPTSPGQDASACVVGDGRGATLRHVYTQRATYTARLTVYGGSCPGAALVVAGRTIVEYQVAIGERDKPASDA